MRRLPSTSVLQNPSIPDIAIPELIDPEITRADYTGAHRVDELHREGDDGYLYAGINDRHV